MMVVHPLCTLMPRLGQILHTLETVDPEDPLMRLQRAASSCHDPNVRAACVALAEVEPYGPYLPIKRTVRGTIHNLVVDPLGALVPSVSFRLHDVLMDYNNPYERLVRACLFALPPHDDLHRLALLAAERHGFSTQEKR